MTTDLSHDLVAFRNLADVPVHWGQWGRTGERKLRKDFKAVLEVALEDLWHCLPTGKPAGILSGGAYVPPPHPPRHSWGTAFDLSGLLLVEHTDPELTRTREWDLIREWKRRPVDALATEAVLRLHLPQVLGPWYNAAHRDHWHVEDKEEARGFSSRSGSDVRYLQALLTHVWGLSPGPVDGVMGPRTVAAAAVAIGGPWGSARWNELLRLSVQLAWPVA